MVKLSNRSLSHFIFEKKYKIFFLCDWDLRFGWFYSVSCCYSILLQICYKFCYKFATNCVNGTGAERKKDQNLVDLVDSIDPIRRSKVSFNPIDPIGRLDILLIWVFG